jgi:hypothetical protein
MQKMMKDLYSANFEDLQKMGVVLRKLNKLGFSIILVYSKKNSN